ncbi:SVM family protein, partial [Candidatus Phytoplasma asteris]|uniref:SVM family protein n=1 Tax=Candidatus Phytoplasma asteris TaxID=85620 RepID=UPI0039E1714B
SNFEIKKCLKKLNSAFVLLGILFITNNYYVMAMNNGHISQNNGHDNDHTNFQNQTRILQNLNGKYIY